MKLVSYIFCSPHKSSGRCWAANWPMCHTDTVFGGFMRSARGVNCRHLRAHSYPSPMTTSAMCPDRRSPASSCTARTIILQMMVLSNWTFSTRYFEGAARFWGILLLFVVSLPALTRARSPKTALFSLQITYHHSLLLNWVVSHRYLDILSLSHDTRCLKLPRCVPFSLAIGYSHIPTVYCSILLL